jgi:hypothetical protein
MFNPAFFALMGSSQKSPKRKAEESRQKLGDDFAEILKRMTPEERQDFWKQHDKDTTASED